MRAAVLYGPRDLRVEECPAAPEPGAGEVTIAVHRCGLCGTDVHEYAHGGPMTPLTRRHPGSGHLGPTVIGHEFTGTVIRSRSDTLAEGSRVVAGAGWWCGECAPCRAGRTNLCDRYFTFGLSTHGGMAEQVTVPAQMCVPVPDACPDEEAVLAQPFAIALHALDRSGASSGSRVLVVGAGGVGALLVVAAADRGMEVCVLDLDPDRLAVARRLGAADARIAGQDGDPAFTGVPTVFETSGAPAGLRIAAGAVDRGGRIVGVGLPARPVEVDTRSLVVSEVDIVTSSAHVCLRDLPAAVDLLTRRRPSARLVARTVPLDRIVPDALEPAVSGAVQGKTVIDVLGKAAG